MTPRTKTIQGMLTEKEDADFRKHVETSGVSMSRIVRQIVLEWMYRNDANGDYYPILIRLPRGLHCRLHKVAAFNGDSAENVAVAGIECMVESIEEDNNIPE